MAVGREELSRRLRTAREACGMRQEDVARHLGVSRPTIAQMELGNRAVTGLELDRLAYLYGRDIREFLSDDFLEENTLVALFRRHPDVCEDEDLFDALRRSIALALEITNLERLLEIDRELAALPAYLLRSPRSRWEAIQQGDRIAKEERHRLGLGKAPLPNVGDLLETQGVRTAQLLLPEDVSGLTLVEPDVGVLVVVNNLPPGHSYVRRRFSCAHEYCHVLLDRDQRSTISRAEDREVFMEVRANAFAASFLMPEEGVEEFVRGLAKGRASRLRADIFDEEQALHAEARSAPGTQSIQMYDLVLLANHFGVSRVSALYRLKNLKHVKDTDFSALQEQEKRNVGLLVAKLLGLREPDHEEEQNEFRRRFLALGLEAFRRGEITKGKLRELGAMVGVSEDDLYRIVVETGIQANDVGSDVLIPGD